jgi:hypothetical protein
MAITMGSDSVQAPATAVGARAVARLRAAFGGEVIGPADGGYDEQRRVWNGSIDRRPAVIARCTSVDDVRTAIRFGRDHQLSVAVRGGGHSFPGLSTCDDGLLIDLRPMKAFVSTRMPGLPEPRPGSCWGNWTRRPRSMALPCRPASCPIPVSQG